MAWTKPCRWDRCSWFFKIRQCPFVAEHGSPLGVRKVHQGMRQDRQGWTTCLLIWKGISFVHPVGMNAEVILWLREGVWEGKDEKGVRYIGSTPECPELGRECMHSFTLQIFIQLLLCQALGIQKWTRYIYNFCPHGVYSTELQYG